MKITGPFFDRTKRGQPCEWYLRYKVPKIGPSGTPEVDEEGRVIMLRKRPYYATRAAAEADKPRIIDQYRTGGGGAFVQSRSAQAEYEAAKEIMGAVSLVDAARYYRQHHPLGRGTTVAAAVALYLEHIKALFGEDEKYYADLKSRLTKFSNAHGGREVNSVTRAETMAYLLGLGQQPRTIVNVKQSICSMFNWLLEKSIVVANPAANIKRRQLPKVLRKEIRFHAIEYVERYLRACEKYDPEFIAHEAIQFFAGVRADDEMENFRGEWVKPATREVVVPAEAAKTGVREVIGGLEENFWEWWQVYGRDGVLRPKNYPPRWRRIRILADATPARAEELATLTYYALKKLPEWTQAGADWPWNARRRTFCTYHVAKYQSADRTQLILRQRGAASTLHNSYRGTGVTPAQGTRYFQIRPKRVVKTSVTKLARNSPLKVLTQPKQPACSVSSKAKVARGPRRAAPGS